MKLLYLLFINDPLFLASVHEPYEFYLYKVHYY